MMHGGCVPRTPRRPRLESNQHPRLFRPSLYRLSYMGFVPRPGLEPGRTVPKTVVLPLHHRGVRGFGSRAALASGDANRTVARLGLTCRPPFFRLFVAVRRGVAAKAPFGPASGTCRQPLRPGWDGPVVLCRRWGHCSRRNRIWGPVRVEGLRMVQDSDLRTLWGLRLSKPPRSTAPPTIRGRPSPPWGHGGGGRSLPRFPWLVPEAGVEPATPGLGNRRSVH